MTLKDLEVWPIKKDIDTRTTKGTTENENTVGV